jgi:hypothetical protein
MLLKSRPKLTPMTAISSCVSRRFTKRGGATVDSASWKGLNDSRGPHFWPDCKNCCLYYSYISPVWLTSLLALCGTCAEACCPKKALDGDVASGVLRFRRSLKSSNLEGVALPPQSLLLCGVECLNASPSGCGGRGFLPVERDLGIVYIKNIIVITGSPLSAGAWLEMAGCCAHDIQQMFNFHLDSSAR